MQVQNPWKIARIPPNREKNPQKSGMVNTMVLLKNPHDVSHHTMRAHISPLLLYSLCSLFISLLRLAEIAVFYGLPFICSCILDRLITELPDDIRQDTGYRPGCIHTRFVADVALYL